MDKCVICKGIIKGKIYSCCRQTKLYCSTCSVHICRTCISFPKIKQTTKQKSQMNSQHYHECRVCQGYQSSTFYQYFHQPKCKYDFCCKCLVRYYQKYFQTNNYLAGQQGIRPDIPFQLPCGCEIPQKDILAFLQQSCYCCGKKIQDNLSYRLNNNLKILKKCMNQLESIALKGRYRISGQKWKQIYKMLIKCEGCDSVMSQRVANQQKLNVCKQCLQLNKRQVKILEKQKQSQDQRQMEHVQVQKKLEKQNEKLKKIKVVGKKYEGKLRQGYESKIKKKLNQQQEEKQINIKNKINQQLIIPKNFEQNIQPQYQQKIELKVIKCDVKIFENLKPCHQCAILIPSQELIFLSEQNASMNFKLLKNTGQKDPQKSSICKLCYLQYKYKQKAQRQRKGQLKFDRSRLYRSMHKSQKVQEHKNNNRSNIFYQVDNYGFETETIKRKLQLQKPNRDTKTLAMLGYIPSTKNSSSQKCNKCYKSIFNIIIKKCQQCEAQEKQLQTKKIQKTIEVLCRLCRKYKLRKESEINRLNYCKQCQIKLDSIG